MWEGDRRVGSKNFQSTENKGICDPGERITVVILTYIGRKGEIDHRSKQLETVTR